MPHGPSPGTSGSGSGPRRCTDPGPTSSRTTDGAARRPGGGPTRSTVTPATPAHGPGPSAVSSTTTSRCGSPAPVPAGRPASSGAHQRRTASASVVSVRSGPITSRRRGCAACGSHLHQSQSAARAGGATTASSASAGLCSSAYWATRARARSRAGRRSAEPAAGSSHTVELSRSDSATGSSSTTACPTRNRRRASAVIGSTPSTGPVRGATRRVASRWGPRPMRSRPKSSSAGRRSHSRPAASTAGQAPASGSAVSSAARCAAATARTRVRIWAR
jgi:hypothetical protein